MLLPLFDTLFPCEFVSFYLKTGLYIVLIYPSRANESPRYSVFVGQVVIPSLDNKVFSCMSYEPL